MKVTLTPCYDEYRVFRCSDCDPDLDEEREHYERPYEVILPVDGQLVAGGSDESGPVDRCPRCDSYLSLCCDAIVTVERKRG